ncbi:MULTISPECIES: carbohydrate ABC transporter permease [Prauserella salsuginis group]|uniref:Carbohydrate ABC transporter permease n=1 Tax=Prauserella salsuginis TaxID=387889 RepID=A0ABW6G1H6_9PSEU|nr:MULTISPECIES: carbohydrate ABC transporter permease [Prauserella salsuginis group]MCR3722198.1 multiple sugar transport system permease protein [Prauserella flava]MCR3736196.1 multiple sugar transport system permease protein [Prauserella salsuginis]
MTDMAVKPEPAASVPAEPPPPRRKRRRSGWSAVGSTARVVATLAILFFVLFPIVWMALTAFKPARDAFSTSLVFTPSLENFSAVLGGASDLSGALVNSVLIGVATTVVAVPLALLAAYGFSRYRFPGHRSMLLAIVATQFIPGVAIALPFLTLFRSLGLIDTHLALVVVNLSIVVPYITWLLKGFVDGLPTEIEEAARIDGCGQVALLWRVITPLAAPGIFVSAVFSFLLAWNEFLFPTFLSRSDATTLPVALMTLVLPEGVAWGQMAAAGLLVMAPMLVMAFLVRKHFAEGMTMGAVK